MKIPLITLGIILGIMGGIILDASFAEASDIYEQTEHGDNSGFVGYNGSQYRIVGQQLGNGLTGQVDQFAFWLNTLNADDGTHHVRVKIFTAETSETNFSSVATTDVQEWILSIPTTATNEQIFLDFDNPHDLDPTKYYYTHFYRQNYEF